MFCDKVLGSDSKTHLKSRFCTILKNKRGNDCFWFGIVRTKKDPMPNQIAIVGRTKKDPMPNQAIFGRTKKDPLRLPFSVKIASACGIIRVRTVC